MYRLSSTSNYYNGMRFESLGDAIRKAKIANEYATTDVMRDESPYSARVVWTNDNAINKFKTIRR